jgi:hypothetical protein
MEMVPLRETAAQDSASQQLESSRHNASSTRKSGSSGEDHGSEGKVGILLLVVGLGRGSVSGPHERFETVPFRTPRAPSTSMLLMTVEIIKKGRV